MRSVAKGQLKAKLLEYMRTVETTGEELVVTDNKVPVLKIIPYVRTKDPAEVFADVQGKVAYHGDILAPETAEWDET
jgi:prevent-host-death family protein